MNQQEAAFLMHCDNVNTFRVHFSRIRGRLGQWIQFLIDSILTLNGIIPRDSVADVEKYTRPLKAQWGRFKYLVEYYMNLYSSLPRTELVIAGLYNQYIHVRLSRNRMGLGP